MRSTPGNEDADAGNMQREIEVFRLEDCGRARVQAVEWARLNGTLIVRPPAGMNSCATRCEVPTGVMQIEMEMFEICVGLRDRRDTREGKYAIVLQRLCRRSTEGDENYTTQVTEAPRSRGHASKPEIDKATVRFIESSASQKLDPPRGLLLHPGQQKKISLHLVST
jgi:hypothetical protein